MNLSAEIFSFTLLFPFRVHYYFFNKKRFDLKHSRVVSQYVFVCISGLYNEFFGVQNSKFPCVRFILI